MYCSHSSHRKIYMFIRTGFIVTVVLFSLYLHLFNRNYVEAFSHHFASLSSIHFIFVCVCMLYVCVHRSKNLIVLFFGTFFSSALFFLFEHELYSKYSIVCTLFFFSSIFSAVDKNEKKRKENVNK